MAYELAADSWDDREIAALHRVIASGQYTMGPEVAAFEADFARFFGRRQAIMTNSGSSANLVSVAAMAHRSQGGPPLRRGDEAIVPAISWATTYHPLQQYGLRLRFVDVELDTLNMDVSRLEQALTDRTRLLVAVSILGNPAALDVMRDFADRYGLLFLEDNCESVGARLNGRYTGGFGDMATASFFFSHHISTMEGGMIVTDDDELAHLARSIRAHGWTRDIPKDSPVHTAGDNAHFEAYRFILPGYNVRPLEFAGAVGRVQLGKLPEMIAERRANMTRFRERFDGDDRFILQRENGESSSFSFTIILNPDRAVDRDRVFAALREADIGFRIITGGNFLRHDVIRHYDYDIVGDAANADIAHDRGFFVGNYPRDLTAEINRLHAVLDRAAR